MKSTTCQRFLFVFGISIGLQIVSAMYARAATMVWSQTGGGPFSWNDMANWTPNTVPNAISDVANFTTAGGPATQSVTLDLPITIGALTLTNSATSYTISNGSGGPLAFDNGASAATITMGAGSVAQSLNADMTFDSDGLVIANNSTVSGATLTISGQVSGGTNLYLTNTTANAGKVILAGNDRLPTNAVLNMFPTNFPTAGGNVTYTTSLDLGTNNQTLSTIKLPFGSNGIVAADNTTGASLTITGTGSSTLTLNGDDFLVGIQMNGTAASNSALVHAVNMSGLSNFVFNNSNKSIGAHLTSGRVSSQARAVGTLTLAANNTITAKSFLVGDVPSGNGNGAGTSTVTLGSVSNVLNIGSTATDGVINVGYGLRGVGNLNLPANAALSIRGFGGGTAPLPKFLVGLIGSNSGSSFTSAVNLGNGVSNAIITQMDLATADAGPSASSGFSGTQTVNFTLGATSGPEHFTVGTLNLGIIANTNPAAVVNGNVGAVGNFTLNNANGVLNAETINFATNTFTITNALAKTVTGTFNLTNGTLRSTTIQLGTQTGTATANRNLNWATGTIENTSGTDLSISSVPINLSTTGAHTFNATGSNSITIANTSVIGGAAGTNGITKTGTGTLVYNANNTYTGLTTVSQGTLLQNGSHTGGGAYTVDMGGTLGGAGTISGVVSISNGGTLSPGNSPETLTVGGLTLQDGAAGIFELLNTSGIHAPGAGNDLLDIVGALTAFTATTVTVDVDAIGGGNLNSNGTWTLGLYDSLAGTGLPAFNITGVDPSYPAMVTVVPDDTNAPLGAGSIVLTVVPEPSSFILAGFGLIGFALTHKRRKK